MPNATLTPAAGVGNVLLNPSRVGIPRSQSVYENVGVQSLGVLARSQYVYENIGIQALSVLARSQYLYENLGIQALAVLARAAYLYEASIDGEVFPWLMDMRPRQQYRGGTVDLYGDGFGEFLEAGAVATITASSTNGGNVPGNAVNRGTSEWVSNDGTGAWIRFTFASAKTIAGLALEDLVGSSSWGVPLFRFSDGGADVVGSSAVGKQIAALQTTEYPVGTSRTYYLLPTPRTVTWVEVRVSSGGAGANRGLGEIWVYEDTGQSAEGSAVISNLGLGSQVTMGLAGTWLNRSPNLWPANGGQPIQKALTVTVPNSAQSGLVRIEETI